MSRGKKTEGKEFVIFAIIWGVLFCLGIILITVLGVISGIT